MAEHTTPGPDGLAAILSTAAQGLDRSAHRPEWWLCPNGQCEHGNILHDVESLDDLFPTCCVEGCPCGKAIGIRLSPAEIALRPPDTSQDTTP